MMERIPMEVGRVVMSRQGRDRDRCFVILSVVDDQFVMMADGLTRKLDHPKRKKVKHLHAKPVKMQDLAQRLASGQVLDSDLRKLLREGISEAELEAALREAIAHKPKRHGFTEDIEDREIRRMNEIGG